MGKSGVTRTCKCGAPVAGKATRCSPCNNAAVREWRQNNPDRAAAHGRKARYGLAGEEFQQMLEAQGGKCAVCGTSEWGGAKGTPHVDHDHTTGTVRGLLCNHCNLALGHAKDNPNLLREMANYLEMASA